MSQQAVVLEAAGRELLQTHDGTLWYVLIAEDEAWVAVHRVAPGGGGGWFRSDSSLDPASMGWTSVSGGEVLAFLEAGRDRAAELTAVMVGTCIVDGLGLEALELADSLLDHGYAVQVSIDDRGLAATGPGIAPGPGSVVEVLLGRVPGG